LPLIAVISSVLRQPIDMKIGYVNMKIGCIDTKIGYIDKKIGYSDKRSGYSDKKIGYSDKKIGYSDKKIGYIDMTIGYIYMKTGYIDTKIGYSDKNIGYSDKNIGYSDKKIGYIDMKIGFINMKIGCIDTKMGYIDTKIGYSDKKIGYNNSKLIPTILSTKILGLTIDSTLSCRMHIDHLTTKLNTAYYVIRSIKPLMSHKTLPGIYNSLFYIVVSYGIILWGNSCHSTQIFRTQKRVIRIIMGCGNSESYRILFKKPNILPLMS